MSPKVTEEENSNSGSDNDETDEVPGQMTGSSKVKKLKRFDYVTEGGKHVHLSKEDISQQKQIEEKAKADAAAQEKEARRTELINLLGQEVVEQCYKNKIKYDKYYDKMLNRRATLRITNCDIRTRKGPIALKVYKEDDTSEINTDFRASDLHLAEWREVKIACPNRKRAKDRSIFFRLHQGPGLDDYARSFSTILLAEVDKRNLNPLKQMRTIEQLSVLVDLNIKFPKYKEAEGCPASVAEEKLQFQFFGYLEDQRVSSLQFMQRTKTE
ncbi:hypothetical protein Tco_1239502 [Tanacetum coccineum]